MVEILHVANQKNTTFVTMGNIRDRDKRRITAQMMLLTSSVNSLITDEIATEP